MAEGYVPGMSVCIIENNRKVREAVVVRFDGELYTIRFREGGGIRLRAGRLYPTQQAAQDALPRAQARRGFRAPDRTVRC